MTENSAKTNENGVVFDYLHGQCPVESEGTICGKPFYFRARGERWSIGIGGDPMVKPEWRYEEPYGTGKFAAGYMELDEARAFIEKSAAKFAAETQNFRQFTPR